MLKSSLIKYLKEIEGTLLAASANSSPSKWKPEAYIGGGKSKLNYLNLKVPQVRILLKSLDSLVQLSPENQWEVWNYVWQNSSYFEAMLGATHFAAKRPKGEWYQQRKILLSWLERVDNWAHSDELSRFYSALLEHSPRELMPVFRKWNRAKNPWKKRQSMVGLLFYSRFRSLYPQVETILEFVARHLEDEHYYVQKAVGWSLRECGNVYPEETFQFLCRNAKVIAPAGWYAATEKLSTTKKEKLKFIRQS